MGMLKFVGGLAGNHIWPDDWVFLYGCSDTDQVIFKAETHRQYTHILPTS